MEFVPPRKIAESCESVYCPRYPDLPTYTGKERVVFVNGDYIEGFAKTVASHIETCIVHNSDKTFGNFEASLITTYADNVRAVNADCLDEFGVVQIPLNISDSQYEYLKSYKPKVGKSILIYSNFAITTNSNERLECHTSKINNVTRSMRKSQKGYYDDLCRSKYVLCPEGTGMDTHRVYEALYCGATPVVKRNPLAPMYERIGGIIIINRWEELNELVK